MSVFKIQDGDWRTAVEDFLFEKGTRCAEATVAFYRNELVSLARWAVENDIPLDKFGRKDMRRYLDLRRGQVSEATMRHDVVAAKNFFKFSFNEKTIDSNPLYDFKPPKAEKTFVKSPSADEIRLILKAIEGRRTPDKNPASRFCGVKARKFLSKRDYAIITGLVETAARAGEILGLEYRDIDRERRQVVFRVTKGNEPRIVPVSQEWLSILDDWLRMRPKGLDNEFVFVTIFGERVNVRPFSRLFKGYCEFAGVEHLTLHSLRHYAITALAENDLWAASQIAGHKDLRVTRGYLHGNPDHVRAAHSSAAPLTSLLGNSKAHKGRRKMIV